MRKIATLILTIVMVLTICTVAQATGDEGTIGADGIASGSNKMTFTKSILMKNGNGTTVREPNITYTYTITEIDTLRDNETVTDLNGYAGTVYKLSAEGGTLSSVLSTPTETAVFEDSNAVTTSATGVETSKDVTFTFNGSAFPHAGVYRFIVTETTSAEKESVGIIENTDYASVMYLDVYVQGQGDHTSIYAYVLFENNDAAIANATKEARQKSAGWCGGDVGTVNQDIYQTYDMEVKKAITGDATSMSHQFPFTITLTNAKCTTKVDLALSSSGATYTTTPTADTVGNYVALTNSGAAVAAKLAHNGTITIKGIPAATTAAVYETNDTHDFYNLRATVEASSTTQAAMSATDGSVAPNGGQSKTTPAINIDGTTITRVQFGNNLTTISPTGYVTRYAPYGLILIAGVVLLVIAKKHKKHTDED